MELTGKVFTVRKEFKDEEKFQLEAIADDGNITRLQSEGPLPEACLYDKRHSGLKVIAVLESFPAQYSVGCNCGYRKIMQDVNAVFEEHK